MCLFIHCHCCRCCFFAFIFFHVNCSICSIAFLRRLSFAQFLLFYSQLQANTKKIQNITLYSAGTPHSTSSTLCVSRVLLSLSCSLLLLPLCFFFCFFFVLFDCFILFLYSTASYNTECFIRDVHLPIYCIRLILGDQMHTIHAYSILTEYSN